MDDLTTPVRQQHKFSVDRLLSYLSVKSLVSNNDTLTVRQYSAGQSNPTFLIQTRSNSYVLRKKPPGELLPGAHKVDREYRVQKALFSAGFPVPQPLLHCTDAEVIGTEFYLMEHVRGRIFRDLRLPGVSAAERTALYVAAVEVLAKLHSLDLASLNLEGYGKGSGYCRRQVSTWTKQYKAAAHRDIPAMNELSDWLMKNLPASDNEVTLVHGDFRLDNLIFHPTEARVIALLDWELSTTGQPLADLAYFLMHHYWPANITVISTMGSLKGIEGIPTVSDLISIYCQCRGIPSALPQMNFYLALSVFKMAGIAQGIYARHLLGNASAPNAAQFSQCVEPLSKVALQLAQSPAARSTEDGLFLQTANGQAVLQQVKDFMRQYILPAQEEVAEYYSKHAQSPQRWHTPQIIEDLKVKAREAGLWNLFLPAVSGLSQLDYAYIAEETGRCLFAPEVFNCQAPDTGNMEVLHMFGSEEQKGKWLDPLLRGEIRSCFCMTEPDVASSDATNMECTLRRDDDNFVINGKKWWSSVSSCITTYKKTPPPVPPRTTPSKPFISITAQSSTESAQDAYMDGGSGPRTGINSQPGLSNSTESIDSMKALTAAIEAANAQVHGPASQHVTNSTITITTTATTSAVAHVSADSKAQREALRKCLSIGIQVDPEEGGPTEEQSKFQSIGIQVEDERCYRRMTRSNSVTTAVQADLDGPADVPEVQPRHSATMPRQHSRDAATSTVSIQGSGNHYHACAGDDYGEVGFDPSILPPPDPWMDSVAEPEVEAQEAVGRSVCPRDGRWFLKLLQAEMERMEGWCRQMEQDEVENELPDEILGKIRSAVGSAQLLMSQKFQQFRELCEENLNPSAHPRPISQDLAGFWDMLQLSIENISLKFDELHQLKANNWKPLTPPEIQDRRMPPPVPKKPLKGHPPLARDRSLESSERQRLEARKRLLAAKRAASVRQSSATESADSIEIYIPEAQTRL